MSVVKTGTGGDSTFYNNSRHLARKSNGDLWCTYFRSNGTALQIYCAYSIDGGINWTEEQLTNQTAGNDQVESKLAIDSSDNVHVVWEGFGWGAFPIRYNIQYRKRTSSWQAQEAVTDIDASQYLPSIAIDAADNIHIAWHGLGWGVNTTKQNIQYRERTSSWQAQVAITDRAYDNKHPGLIWALCPTVSMAKTNRPKTGYALVWSGQIVTGYQVEYVDASLTWDTPAAPKGGSVAARLVAAGVI